MAFGLLVVGLRFAVKTHAAYSKSSEDAGKFETVHKNLMTAAVVVSGLGVVIWMLPNFLLGWNYKSTGLGYGTGGYSTYFEAGGNYLPQWFLIPVMVVVGTATAVLGVYLVLRMRWSGFPQRLAVQNYRRVMIITWSLWTLNVIVGILVFYFFAYPPFPG